MNPIIFLKQVLGIPLSDEEYKSIILTQPRRGSTPTPSPSPTPMPQFDRMTYYLPTGNLTSTGTVPQTGYTAAISRQLKPQIPMGSLIKLPNGKIVRVEDVTAEDLLGTLDLFYQTQNEANYPEKGRMLNVPYQIVGRDTTGMKYNYE